MRGMAVLALGAALAVPTAVAAQSPGLDPTANGAPSLAAQDAARIVFQTDLGTGNVIYLARLDGSDARALVPDVTGDQVHPDWSPDGEHIAFVVDGDLWLSEPSGQDAHRLLVCPDGCDYPAWSPDGASLAYTAYEHGPNAPAASSIRVMDVASKSVTDVVREERPRLVDVPRWAPDGQRLVVGVDQMDDDGNETGAAIGVVPMTGGEIRYLRDFDTFAYYPDWSWVTDSIVFSTEALGYQATLGPGDDTWDLWTIRPDGTDVRQVTDVPAGTRLWQPSWSPDGQSIIADRESDRVGVLVDATTGVVDELAYRSSAVTHPRLQPAQ